MMLLTMPSPVRDDMRQAVPLVGLAALGACAVVLALRMNRPASARRDRAPRRLLAEAREGLLSRRNGPACCSPPSSCSPDTWRCSSSPPASPESARRSPSCCRWAYWRCSPWRCR
ncbi:hypothetical protein ACR6C2_41010 [Streptomyces sp. INA 01156]